jgi:hypothetical protein
MIFLYILKSKQIENFSIDHTRIRNTYFRLSLPILGSMLGILIAGLSTQIALALYFIPIIFNFFPISMSELEKRIRTMSSKESQIQSKIQFKFTD